MIPSGSSTQAVQAFYNYLWSVFHASIPADRTKILWTGPFWIYFFAALLILFFFFFVRYALRSHRKKGEMYGVASFAGSILERMGPAEAFTWFTGIVITLWAVYYIVTQILYGYQY